jgi:hypothetical protein
LRIARTQHAVVRSLLAADMGPSMPAAAKNNRHAPLTAGREPHTDSVRTNATFARFHHLTAFHRSSSAPGQPCSGIPRPSRALQRRLAFHAAARELLRRPRSAPRHVASRARSEISIQFAHRWAAIRRMPPEERAAAAAALRSEEEAALAARMTHLLAELRHEARADSAQRRARFATRRDVRLNRRREFWAAAATLVAATISVPRRPRPPTPAPAPPQSMRA